MYTDKYAIEKFKQLVNTYGIKTVVETGTYEANGTLFFARFVNKVFSVEIQERFFENCKKHLVEEGYTPITTGDTASYARGESRITLIRGNSPEVISRIIEGLTEPICFYLDAHWLAYWPIKDEIRAIKPRPESIIIIHDFKVPGKDFGYDCWAGVTVNHRDLEYVNPNSGAGAGAITVPHPAQGFGKPLDYDLVKDDLAFVNPDYQIFYNEKAAGGYRGILYALPKSKE